MAKPSQRDVTQALVRVGSGDESAIASLLPVVYDELRALAGSFFRKAAPQTLEPTALVHEAYIKIVGAGDLEWQGRAHFFALAAKAMRQVLTDHVRSKRTAKRGGHMQRVSTIIAMPTPTPDVGIDLEELDRVLSRLVELDPRQYSIVEMRFLGGLSIGEIAGLLGVSSRTVEREWRSARAWLRKSLDENIDT